MDVKLPGLNCGSCGFKTCSQFYEIVLKDQTEIKRCVYIKKTPLSEARTDNHSENALFNKWVDSLGREFDFILEPLKGEEGGIIEFIHPFNNNVAVDLKLKKGDIIIGRPLAAGCPVTHCGKIVDIDSSGIIKWSVIGPLAVRNKPFQDIGNYTPVVFEGIVERTKTELKVGMRYHFMPRCCMLQWRHSGLISFISKQKNGFHKVRIEGLMLG